MQLAREPGDPTTLRSTIVYDTGLSTEYVNTEIYLLKSRLLAGEVLRVRPDVAKALEGAGDAIGVIQGAVFVRPVKDTRLIEIGCEGTDKKLLTLISNAVAETYCRYKSEEYAKLSNRSAEALEKEIPKLQTRIENAQTQLNELIQKEGTLPNESELVLERLKAYEEALNHVQRDRVRADAEIENIERVRRADQPIESAPAIGSSLQVQRLRADLAQAELELSQLVDRGYPESCPLPKVRAVRTRRDQLRDELKHEVETLRTALVALRDTKLGEEQGLERIIAQLRDQARRLNQQSQRHTLLEKEIAENSRLRDELLRRSNELGAYSKIESSPAKVIDQAREPGAPIRPNRPRTIAMGLVAGLLSGLALAYLLERLDTRIRSADDVRLHLANTDIFALVPKIPDQGSPHLERLAITSPESPFAEAFRRLRAQIQASVPGRSILVTSGAPNEGKSVTAINIAIAHANAGSRVVLIDADMRNPRVHRIFDADLEPGLAECLAGDANPRAVVRETEVPNLFLMSAGRPTRNPAELIASSRSLERVLEALGERYDRIVIDTPPSALLSDASIMAPHVETVLLVVSTLCSKRRATRMAFASLAGVGRRPLGVILNHMGDHDLRDLYYEYYRPLAREPAQPRSE